MKKSTKKVEPKNTNATDIIKRHAFVGTEVEGRYEHAKTLFLPPVIFQELLDVGLGVLPVRISSAISSVAKEQSVTHIYIGAGGASLWSTFNVEVLHKALECAIHFQGQFLVTVELDVSSLTDNSSLSVNGVCSRLQELTQVRVYLTVDVPDVFPLRDVEVKLVSSSKCLSCQPYQLLDYRYAKDKRLGG